MHSGISVDFGHGRDVGSGRLGRPCPESTIGNRAKRGGIGGHDYVVTIEPCTIAHPWRVFRQVEPIRSSHHTHLEQAFDTVEALQNQFVTRIELDAWLSIDAFSTKLCTQLALWFRSIATGFSRAANLTLANSQHRENKRRSVEL